MPNVEQVKLKSGRHVAVYRLAERPDARTIVFCHAAPGSGLFDPQPELTASRNVSLISVDRLGYGASEPVGPGEWASVASAADDLAEVLDQLGTGPVGVVGWSAGGRVALALAARRPELADRVAVLCTPAPDEEVPWIPPEYKQALEAMRGQPPEQVHAALAQQLAAQAHTDPYSSEALNPLGYSPADASALDFPGARQRLGEMLAAAYAQGAVGMAADIAGYCLQPWGFEPQDVQAKTLLLYGAKDPVVSAKHGTWWQKHLPQARLEMVPNAGHLLVIPMWQRVLSHLAPNTRR